MDAFHILRRRFGMIDLVFLRQPRIAVALRAGEGEVQLEHRRGRILDRQNVMRPVAIPAIRRTGRTEQVAHAVNAGGVIRGLFRVAWGAIGRRQRAVVDEVFDIIVAIHAGELRVNRLLKGVRRENQRFDLPVDHARGVGIEMAGQTITVGKLFGRVGGDRPLGIRDGTRK